MNCSEYYDDERSKEAFRDGLLHTGDVVTFDEEGFVKIVDRIKDIIENGGKWISSVDLENNLMAQEAMVIAVPHLEWRERSIACAVIEEGKTVAKRELYDFL